MTSSIARTNIFGASQRNPCAANVKPSPRNLSPCNCDETSDI